MTSLISPELSFVVSDAKRNLHTHYSSPDTDSTHEYRRPSSDWGFSKLLPLADLFNTSRGFLVDDTLRISLFIRVKPPPKDQAT